jgi:hypothetical protein
VKIRKLLSTSLLAVSMLISSMATQAAPLPDRMQIRSDRLAMGFNEGLTRADLRFNGAYRPATEAELAARPKLKRIAQTANFEWRVNERNITETRIDKSRGKLEFYPADSDTLPAAERQVLFDLKKDTEFNFGPLYSDETQSFLPNCEFIASRTRLNRIRTISTLAENEGKSTAENAGDDLIPPQAFCRGTVKVLAFNRRRRRARVQIEMQVQQIAASKAQSAGNSFDIIDDYRIVFRIKADVDPNFTFE